MTASPAFLVSNELRTYRAAGVACLGLLLRSRPYRVREYTVLYSEAAKDVVCGSIEEQATERRPL